MLIEVQDLTVSYGKKSPVLNRISFGIEKGDFIGIIGKAGCGKTTFLDVIAGLHKPNSGHVFFQEEEIYGKQFDRLNFRRKLQIVFQFPENQFFETTAANEVAFGPKILKYSPEETETLVRDAFAAVGLDYDSVGCMTPFALSGGQKRRLAIASALAVSPEVLLLDEPFSGLDAEGQSHLSDTLRTLHRQGITILLVSHDPNTLCDLAETITVLGEGRILRKGSPQSVFGDTSFCRECGIGQPDIQILSDLLGMDSRNSYNYAQFIEKLTSYLSGGVE